jgi:hypothetical protein
MAFTLGSGTSAVTIKYLTAQPCQWQEADVQRGLIARAWTITGLVSPAAWKAIDTLFSTWSTSRQSDDDPFKTAAVGVTVPFSGSANGISWSNVACWFTGAPTGEQVSSAMVRVSFGLVDATQQLAVLLRREELSREATEAHWPDYGTWSAGGATLTLLQEPDGYDAGPQMDLTAGGGAVIQGPLAALKTRKIKGYTDDATAWQSIRTWYEATIAARPSSGAWFPVAPPTREKTIIVINGAKTTRHTISLDLKQAP